jgi:hypothetical protein
MSTLTAKPRNVKPASGTCKLVLVINEVPYAVTALCPDGELASRAYALHKPDGKAYYVAETEHGATCDCPDWVFHRDGKDPRGCKHILACRAWGLLPELPETDDRPAPVIKPPAKPSPYRSVGDFAADAPGEYEDWLDGLNCNVDGD